MQQPLEFYKKQKTLVEQELVQLKKKLTISSSARLLTFFGTILGVYLFLEIHYL